MVLTIYREFRFHPKSLINLESTKLTEITERKYHSSNDSSFKTPYELAMYCILALEIELEDRSTENTENCQELLFCQ